ncbi:HEAT repeat domain-containing protein [Candidatus Micrarchaeota archaeon]|nr:HEAT repeat domain-containing protein [Candidatus Micrarchaeota archaeon]
MQADINKLVSLTFDENPKVRMQAAESLGSMDDPAAIFALVELSYDKDPSVRDVALKKLEKKKQTEAEVMSFAEIFSSGSAEEQATPSVPADAKEKVLRPITQIFEKRLGKERADAVKSKMLPTIEKIYLKVHHPNKKRNEEDGRKAMQEFLTSYMEVMSDLDQIGNGVQILDPHESPVAQTVLTPVIEQEDELQEVGKSIDPKLSSEIAEDDASWWR